MFENWQIKVSEYPEKEKEYEDAANWANLNNHEIKIESIDGEDWYKMVSSEREKTVEEVKQIRAELYVREVDPLTAHINRLRDEEQTPEIVAKIASLVEERKAIVAKIKAENPYPTETANGGI